MEYKTKKYEVVVGNQTMIIETGKLALQAGGAVTVRLGDSIVLGTATMSKDPRMGINFFPLSVDFEERLYAGGKIPGSFFRREGRPTELAILTARLTDRSLRPLFPKDLRNDVQVILHALSADDENPLDILAVNAASAALIISDISWGGPIAAVRIGRINQTFIINPTYTELKTSDLDLRIAGSMDAIMMVECGANEVSEAIILEGLELGHKVIKDIIQIQHKMAEEIGKSKRKYQKFTTDDKFNEVIHHRVQPVLNELLSQDNTKAERRAALEDLEDEVLNEYLMEEDIAQDTVGEAFETAYKNIVRERILSDKKRLDGRTYNEIRPIFIEVDYSPRAHGSGIFTRGETQVLTIATLGTPREAQALDNLTPNNEKRYIHHYNFPPFSTGETKFLRGASRREIGHGALAERALLPVIPSEEEFPYTLRLVSEVLSSNGSSSMASVCGSTLALMDTGVPIKAPVAGIAMGLIKENDRYAILTDILGAEDHLGDMDFKVAGTSAGITALQMDIKIKGISTALLSEALEQARHARLAILDKILAVISEPRKELKPHVPRISTVKIPVDKIGAVIGPGGKTIRSIQEDTGVKIDIGEDGTVFIASIDRDGEQAARHRIESITESPVIGRIYTGKVSRTTDFGAFVEILPNLDGLVHISQLDSIRIEKVEDVARVGDELTVMITGIDPAGKIRLSRQAVLEGWTVEEAQARDQPKRSSNNRGRRDDRRPPRRN